MYVGALYMSSLLYAKKIASLVLQAAVKILGVPLASSFCKSNMLVMQGILQE